MPDPTTLTLDEAIAILEGNETLETPEAMEQRKKEKEKAKVKDLLKEGSKQGRAGLGLGTSKMLEEIED